MTTRNLAVTRIMFVGLTVAAIALVSLTNAVAETSVNNRDPVGGVTLKDGTEFLNNAGGEQSLGEMHSYSRANYIWPYSTGPQYPAVDIYQQSVLWTPAGVFRLQGELAIPVELRASGSKLDILGAQYYAVAYNTELDVLEDLRSAIESSGGVYLESPSDGSLIAKLSPAALAALHSAVGVLAIEPYHGAFKLEPSIGRTPMQDPIRALSDTYSLEVSLWRGEDPAAVAEAILAIGGSVSRTYPDSLEIELHRSLLPQLVDIEAVRMVTENLPRMQLGEETTSVMQSWDGRIGWIGATPYHDAGVTGAGANPGDEQVLMVLDSGFSLDAGDLSDTRTDVGVVGSAHRKVRVHQSTNQFGGTGDTTACDAPPQGGFTHGHVVAATALGNATNVDSGPNGYGTGWNATDQQGNPWELDGVARGAVLVAYDGQITPPNGSCSDPMQNGIITGDLYSGAATGSLGESYVAHGARAANFSWGQANNVYDQQAGDIDQFLFDKKDAMVFISAGNFGQDILPPGGDGVSDPETLGAPSTAKNGLCIGASRNANTFNSPSSRAAFSSVGPAVNATVNRVAPQLMAPGDEPGGGSLGLSSEFSCRSSDNNQTNPVECDIVSGVEGTSFSAPAAAGSALLVRDYFRQGFHPDAVQNAPDSIEIGGALIKAVLSASADFMTGANISRGHRWNNEQGYGRIRLDNALPLNTWARSPTGLLIHDPFSATTNLGLPFTISTGQTHGTTFEVCNDEEELRVVLAWIDDPAGPAALRNDLNLTMISPTGIEYRGNYFTDDDDQDGNPEGIDGCSPAGLPGCEDCGGIGAEDVNVANQLIDENQWSLPVCDKTSVLGKNSSARDFDNANPTEGIFLSHDPERDDLPNPPFPGTGGNEGLCTANSSANALGACGNNLDCRINPAAIGVCVNQDDYQQTELGQWILEVKAGPGTILGNQEFAVAVAGGVCLGSVAKFDRGSYTCNERATITITEIPDGPMDPSPSEADIESRTTVQVVDSDNNVVDTETGLNFTQDPNGLKFVSDTLQLTDGTARDPENGALDIRDGDTVRVAYQDIDPDTGLDGALRTNTASVGCKVQIGFGTITFGQFGQDASTLVLGGCERNARQQFEFGFPDRYMDAGEAVIFNFAFNSNEPGDLESVMATLSCVNVDADSPAQCLPNGAGCQESGGTAEEPDCGGPCDPLRLNNTACQWMTVLDPVLNMGFIPGGVGISANFAIEMAGDGSGQPFEDTGGGQPTPTVEMLLTVEAAVSGKTGSALAISRQQLNRDTLTEWYSTDYPTGGTEVLDHGPGIAGNNNEIAEDPITELGNFQGNDYRFETFVFGDLTAGGTKNLNLLAPWNFDGNDGGFLVGLAAASDETAADSFNIANWGEDKNFNNIEDGICLSDPATACYSFPSDVRCPSGSPICVTTENNDPLNTFNQHWNTKGGCGWQTRATGECTGDATRGCFGDDDCLGTCHVLGNDIASGFEPCINNGACPSAQACASASANPLSPCTADADCGGGLGSCQNVTQQCNGEAGICGAIVGDHTGGVWHTGEIGTPDLACTGGAGSACANYKVIADTNGELLWWELLVTPVMEKVNTNANPDGTNEATIEIFDWGWNSQINLSDGNTAYSWEFDTDVSKLEPVDLFSDGSVLGIADGAYGAVDTGSNPDLTNGWPIFAPQGVCDTSPFGPCDGTTDCAAGACTNSSNACHVDAECAAGGCTGGGGESCFSTSDCPPLETCTSPAPEGCVGAPTCDFTGLVSVNGGPGNNSRVGEAGCFFEGAIDDADGFGDLGLAQPTDDDLDNDGDLTADEYVQDDGPYRNTDIVQFNGPDMRFATLEDFFGDTGDTFQAAIGFLSFEGTPSSEATQSFGLAVDDMVVKWREYTLEEDATDCASSGSCAVIQLSTTNVFDGQAVLTVTVLDTVPSVNDCDLDGTPDATFDCSGDGTPDVVIRATSEAEISGEILFLDETAVPNEYVGEVVVSVLSDSPGVLFLAPEGTDNPTVTVTYVDEDIDPGPGVEVCPSDVDPAKHGILQDFNTVFLFSGGFQPCEVVVVGTSTTDNGDGDFFPDTEEIVEMQVTLINNCGVDLNNCTARLFSNSPEVDCILDANIDVGDMVVDSSGVGDPVVVNEPFVWKVADLNRPDIDTTFEASFNLTLTCDQFDALGATQSFSVTLDLDLNDLGQTPTAWTESFESATLGKFFPENLDNGIPGANNAEGLINGDGYRCQYSDPDWVNSNPYGNPAGDDCYPGNTLNVANSIYWGIDGIDTGSPDGGRSIDGSYAAYYGIYLTDPAGQFTTPVNAIESIALADPINLGVDVPELTFWHQISVFDGRGLNMPTANNSDRGVVQGKLLNTADEDITDWFNLEPFQNSYGTQAFDGYFNCLFDPTDDGSTEDDFFDPTDPNRRLGPSSSCFPGFQWSCAGETALPFAVGNICNASTEPAADSHDLALGTGTWIETKVNLSAFRGQRMKLRYIVTGLRLQAYEDWEEAFGPDLNPDPIDDGWWVDNIRVSESLETAAVLQVDGKNLQHCAGDTGVGCYTSQDCIDNGTSGPCTGDAPKCGATCTTLSAEIETTPDETGGALDELLAAPGQPITLDASGSTGTCLDGALQYRFSKGGVPDPIVLRGFSENPIYLDAPQVDTDFTVDIRCSTDGPAYACSDPANSPNVARTVDVDVTCPTSGSPLLGYFQTILAQDKTTWGWTTAVGFELLQGDLGGVSTYVGTTSTGSGTSFSDATLPQPGGGQYYIVRELGAFCNEVGSWSANECVLGDSAATWWPAPGSGGVDPTCDRDADIP